MARRGTPQERRAARRQLRDERTALVTWWLQRMAVADQPLREKLTLLWHDHFATSIQKVRLPALMAEQRQTLYELGAGRFDTLLTAMVRDPAMLIWLDGAKNVAGRPNENFAREFLELFTLGHGSARGHGVHGTQPYEESDVADAARAFTGWSVRRSDGTSQLRPARHDAGAKTVLGRSGPLGADDVVAAVIADPACAPHVVSRLWSRLARRGGPDDPVVRELAEPFAEDRDVTSLLRRIFLHEEFLAVDSRQSLVKMPIELVVGAARALGVAITPRDVAGLEALGQVPFLPPDVAGWPADEGWLSTAWAQARLQSAADLAARADLRALAGMAPDDRPRALSRMFGVASWGHATTSALAASADPRAAVILALVAPEHVLA